MNFPRSLVKSWTTVVPCSIGAGRFLRAKSAEIHIRAPLETNRQILYTTHVFVGDSVPDGCQKDGKRMILTSPKGQTRREENG